MKTITAKKIIANMLENKIVNLRKNKHGTISEKTWDLLCDVLFSYGYRRIENYPIQNGFIEIKLDDNFILSSKIKVY
jgi:hypothetical protein